MSNVENASERIRKSSMPRRVTGYIIGRLLPPQRATPKTDVEIAVDNENAIIDQRQQAHFRVNLLQEMYPASPSNIERMSVLRNLFESELTDRHSIADRFSLFAEPFYAPFINTLDLGETKQPGSHDEVAALKAEYLELLAKLTENGVINGELSRNDANPTIHLSNHPKGDFVSATRNRELFTFSDQTRKVSVAKRMTFLMPNEAVDSLNLSDQAALTKRQDVARIERLIDKQNAEVIIPVRTVYYARSKLLKPIGS